jgi:hypothetical protein
MMDSHDHPADYNGITHNCGHSAFEIAQHGWPGLVPMHPYPSSFLDVVKLQYNLRKRFRAGTARGVGGLIDIFEAIWPTSSATWPF